VPVQAASVGGMWGFFFTATPVVNYATAKTSDTERFARFFHACLDDGVYLAPSQFEAAFVSTAHDDAMLEETRQVFLRAMERAG
jgi:glutamate-1-semialdehyde 2,1-aminomutase